MASSRRRSKHTGHARRFSRRAAELFRPVAGDSRNVEIFIKTTVEFSVLAQLRQNLDSQLAAMRLQNDFSVENIVYESVAIFPPTKSGQDQLHNTKQCLNGISSKYQVNTEYVQVTIVFYNSTMGDDNTRQFIDAFKKALSQTTESTKVCPGTKWKVYLKKKYVNQSYQKCETDVDTNITFYCLESENETDSPETSFLFNALSRVQDELLSCERDQLVVPWDFRSKFRKPRQ